MNLVQVTSVAQILADVMAKGNVARGEAIDDTRQDLKWEPGDQERTLAILLKHLYPGESIDKILSDIKSKYNEQ